MIVYRHYQMLENGLVIEEFSKAKPANLGARLCGVV